jgi:type I restriction enzyme S subunit
MKRKEILTTENTERTEVDAVASGHSVVNTEDLPDGFQMTELGPLPKEWRVVRLGEVAEKPQYGFTAAAQRDPVGPKMLRITDIQDGNVNWNAVPYCECGNDDIPKYLLEAGDILFARTGSVGKAFLVSSVPEPSIFASYLIRVRVDRTRLDPQFAFLFMQSAAYWSQIASQTHGAVQPNVNATQLRSLLLPLPPLDEQRAIAHVLRTVQRAKEATEGVIAALKELKKSLMQHLFTYGPVPVTERERVALQETEIGPIPAHWRVVRLGEIARVKYGKAKPINEHGNIPVIGSGGIYGWTAEAAVDFATLIIGRKGTAGQVWLSETPSWPSDTTFYLEWKSHTTVDVRFIYGWFLLNPLSGEHAKTTIPSLQRPDLENSLVPLPPLDEQREIARILQAVDAKIAAEQARRAALEELFKSLLHELMSGRLRLPNIVGRQRSRDSAPDADPLPELED